MPRLQTVNLLLTTDTVGGVWTYAIGLAAALRPAGVRVALASMGGPLSPVQQQQVANLPHVTLFESTYKLEWMPDCWDDVAAAGQWLLAIARAFRPDVVHLNQFAFGTLPWDAPVLMVAHSDVLSWWQAVKGEPAPPEWDRYREVVMAGLRAADRVIAPSAAMLSETQRLFGPFKDAGVIYNGFDPSAFAAAEKEPFVLAAGRLWDEAKNLETLDRAAAGMAWPVCVAGDQTGFDGRSAAATAVRPLGRLHPGALAGWMARAAIYAMPARYEPFGLSVLEAALSGCALVLGDIPSLREIWGDAAAYVAPNDAATLRRRLDELISDPDRRADSADRARERARRYTVAAMAEHYRAEYRALVRGHDRRSSVCAS